MFWKKFTASATKRSKKTEKAREKLQNYQEETFYILQKLKHMKADQDSLESLKSDHFARFLQSTFDARSNALTFFNEGDLQTIGSILRRGKIKNDKTSDYMKISEANKRNEWVTGFVENLKSEKWRFDNSEFEKLKESVKRQGMEMGELRKEMKSKAEYEEEVIMLKNQVLELKAELARKEREREKERAGLRQRTEELEEANRRLVGEIQMIKKNSFVGFDEATRWGSYILCI